LPSEFDLPEREHAGYFGEGEQQVRFCAGLSLHLGPCLRYPCPAEEQGTIMIVKELTEHECTNLLREAKLGHLACASANRPYVVPITFAFADKYIYSFSLIGQKIEWMRRNPDVCLQVDDFEESRGWKSVVVYGVFEELPDRIGSKRERDHAWSLLNKHATWWEPGGLKPVTAAPASSHLFYRIRIERLTGRQAVEE
jgi:nitroimidazol reductase NimA-like FMN-containing flavoprotein (pyridoxamine 5'-phosphate oxidase superfamily)